MVRLPVGVALCVAALGCGRTGLLFDGPDASTFVTPGEDASPVDPCPEGRPETCDGRDEDCDDEVDEDVAPEPCPTGGSRYCMGGRWSRCPCACVPGAVRYCFDTYCTGWGVASCQADGEWSNGCSEVDPPPGCDMAWEPSPESEECCLELGGCCTDTWDMDGDGDTAESIGACGGIACN